MAEVEIRLRIDPHTGKKTVTIAYHSDADALPMEHEEEHRRIVSALLAKGLIAASEAGEIVVERVESAPTSESAAQAEAAAERESLEHKE